MKKILIIVQLFCFIIPLHAAGTREKNNEGVISVFVSILPQVYFVERIGGDRVTVSELVPPGREPHVFEPGPKQMASLSKADIYFTIGVPFEKIFLPKIKDSLKQVKIVQTEEGITFRHMKDHQHEQKTDTTREKKAEEEAIDPHTWLGTKEVKIQLQNILSALIEFDPPGRPMYESNYTAFINEIDQLHTRTKKALGSFKGKKFFVFHPAFGYFADEYDLEQFPVEIEGKEPGARQLARIIEIINKEKVRALFVQQQFSQTNAKTIAEHTGCVVISVDPLKKDWLSNMEELAMHIEKGLKD